MVNVILDTNQWIYLANGADPHSGKQKDGHHILLLEFMVKMVQDQEIVLWKTDLIEDEWRRNKAFAYELIKTIKERQTTTLTELRKLNEVIGRQADPHVNWLADSAKKYYTNLIRKNHEHIARVDYLVSSSETFFIREKVHGEVNKWAIEKKAPFKGKKSNSAPDATILFGAIDYFDRMRSPGGPLLDTVFVSGNSNDFSQKANKQVVHEDLAGQLAKIGMQFFISLPRALHQIHKSLQPKDEDQEIDRIFNLRFGELECLSCSSNDSNMLDAFVGFGDPQIITTEEYAEKHVDGEQDYIRDGDVLEDAEKAVIQLGFCGSCSVAHIKCACGDVLCADEEKNGLLTCGNCAKIYSLDYDFDSNTVNNVWLVMEKSDTEN